MEIPPKLKLWNPPFELSYENVSDCTFSVSLQDKLKLNLLMLARRHLLTNNTLKWGTLGVGLKMDITIPNIVSESKTYKIT